MRLSSQELGRHPQEIFVRDVFINCEETRPLDLHRVRRFVVVDHALKLLKVRNVTVSVFRFLRCALPELLPGNRILVIFLILLECSIVQVE